MFGVALAICGFSFGVHSVRTPYWLHFRHAHAVLGIITFILTIFQFLVGLYVKKFDLIFIYCFLYRVGAIFVKRRLNTEGRLSESNRKLSQDGFPQDTWAGEGAWRIIHRILGTIVLILGIVNISLGVFLAVLPLPVWVIWFIYMAILIIIFIILEIRAYTRRGGPRQGGSLKLPGKKINKEFVKK